MAKKRGQSLAEMALSWLLAHEGVTSVLIGASKSEQILADLKALDNTSFSTEETKLIDQIALGETIKS